MTVVVLAQKQKLGSQKYLKLQYYNVQCHVFTAQAMLQQNACIQSHALDSLTLWGPHILQSSLRSPTCSCIYELPDPEGRKTKNIVNQNKHCYPKVQVFVSDYLEFIAQKQPGWKILKFERLDYVQVLVMR